MNTEMATNLLRELIDEPAPARLSVLKTKIKSLGIDLSDALIILNQAYTEKVTFLKNQQEQLPAFIIKGWKDKSLKNWETALLPILEQLAKEELSIDPIDPLDVVEPIVIDGNKQKINLLYYTGIIDFLKQRHDCESSPTKLARLMAAILGVKQSGKEWTTFRADVGHLNGSTPEQTLAPKHKNAVATELRKLGIEVK